MQLLLAFALESGFFRVAGPQCGFLRVYSVVCHVAGGQCALLACLLACLLAFSKQFSFILGVSGVTGRENDRTQNARRGLLMCCES